MFKHRDFLRPVKRLKKHDKLIMKLIQLKSLAFLIMHIIHMLQLEKNCDNFETETLWFRRKLMSLIVLLSSFLISRDGIWTYTFFLWRLVPLHQLIYVKIFTLIIYLLFRIFLLISVTLFPNWWDLTCSSIFRHLNFIRPIRLISCRQAAVYALVNS